MLEFRKYGLIAAVALSAWASSALALGVIPPRPGGDGTISTPAPIAGAGLAWMGIAGVGGYLIYRFRRRK
jgi:hypothetical protein